MSTNLRIKLIRLDGGTQPRAGLTEEVVAAYGEELRRGTQFPPVTVYYDGATYWLADGYHRVTAASAIGKDRIAADVRQGTQRDAILHSVGANNDHGLRRSNEDKQRAVRKLLDDSEWRQWSDREIARQCAVNHDMVGRLRKLTGGAASEDNPNGDQRTYVTRHGTPATMNTAAIGAAAYAEIWQLEQGIRTWLTRQTADQAKQIALLTAIRERTTRGLIALDDLLAAPELPAPRRKGDVNQAANNVLEQFRSQRAGGRSQAPEDSSPPVLCPLPATPHPATFAQVQAGVTSWLAENYPGDGREVLQAIVAGAPDGVAHQQAIFRSGLLPDVFRPSDVSIACAALLDAHAAADAPEPASFPLTIGATTIVHADSRNLTAHVAPGSAHLVITSPPYNVGIAYGDHDDNLTDGAYLALLRAVFAECYSALTVGGRIAVVAPHGVGRNPWQPLAARIAEILTNVGFVLRGQIVWDKQSSGNRTTWGSWESSNNPALRDTNEAILVAHKGRADLNLPQPLPADWLPGELFMMLTQDLWAVRAETHDVGHPAPFPVELAERLVRLYGFPGCHVLDPFGGSGSTAIAAASLGCQATLVDVDAAYCKLAAQRVQRAQSQVKIEGVNS